MKPSLIVVTTEENDLWLAYVEAKAKADVDGTVASGIEMKRRLHAFYCYNSPIIQQNLGVV